MLWCMALVFIFSVGLHGVVDTPPNLFFLVTAIFQENQGEIWEFEEIWWIILVRWWYVNRTARILEYLSTIMRRAANFASRLPFSIFSLVKSVDLFYCFCGLVYWYIFVYPASLLFSSPTFSVGSTFLTYACMLSFAVENLVVFFWARCRRFEYGFGCSGEGLHRGKGEMGLFWGLWLVDVDGNAMGGW